MLCDDQHSTNLTMHLQKIVARVLSRSLSLGGDDSESDGGCGSCKNSPQAVGACPSPNRKILSFLRVVSRLSEMVSGFW